MTRFTMLVLTALCASACGGNPVRYVEVPGDAGVVVQACDSDTDCPDGQCDLETGFCVRVEERVVEHIVQESCNGLDDDNDGAVDESTLRISEPVVVYESEPCTAIDVLEAIWTGSEYGAVVIVKSNTPPGSRAEGACFGAPYTWVYYRSLRFGSDGTPLGAVPIHDYITSPVSGYGYDVAWNGSVFVVLHKDYQPTSVSRVAYLVPTDGSAPTPFFSEGLTTPVYEYGTEKIMITDGRIVLFRTVAHEDAPTELQYETFESDGIRLGHGTIWGVLPSANDSLIGGENSAGDNVLLWHENEPQRRIEIGVFFQTDHGGFASTFGVPTEYATSASRLFPRPEGMMVVVDRSWGSTYQSYLLDERGQGEPSPVTWLAEPVFMDGDDFYGSVRGYLVRSAADGTVLDAVRSEPYPGDVHFLHGQEGEVVTLRSVTHWQDSPGGQLLLSRFGCSD